MLYIFDWDGTLSDSLDRIASALSSAMLDHGIQVPSLEERKAVVGLSLKGAFIALCPDVSEKQLQGLLESYREHYLAADESSPSPLFEGAMDVLESLKASGHDLAVATGKSRAGLDRILAHMELEGFFSATRCADETRSKPDPLMILELVDELQVLAQDAIMIGDTDFDLNMAKAAGVGSVGVTYGAHSKEWLVKTNPDRLIDNLSELLD